MKGVKGFFLHLVFLGVSAGIYLPARAQKLSLEACQNLAVENYPMILQHKLIDEAKEYSVKNLNRNYLPQVSLQGMALWSDGIDMPESVDVDMELGQGSSTTHLAFPVDIDLPEVGKDYYNIGLSLEQVIWAGGRIKAGKKVAEAETDMLHGGLDAKLYEIRNKVKDLFFGILILDGRIEQLWQADEILAKTRERVEVALKNGVVYKTDLDAVDVERLKYKKQREDLEIRLESFLQMLSRFVHQEVTSVDMLEVPETATGTKGDKITRPELNYLDLKKKRIDADLTMLNAENMPKLGLFVAGGFSRGGWDMDGSKDFSPNIVGGVSFTWDFGKLYTRKNDKRLLRVRKESVELERESFEFNTRTELVQHDKDIERLERQLEDDAEMVRLRENIARTARVKYENGVCTIAELIADINAAHIAKQEMIIRELELKMAQCTRDMVAGQSTKGAN